MKLKFVLLMLITFLSAQTKTYSISGFIYDEENGESLIGANIFIASLGIGASTNVSGYYVIPEVPKGTHKITISYIGYQDQVEEIFISTGNITNLNYNLKKSVIQTEEVVVKGDSVRIAEKLFTKPVSKIDLNRQQVNQIPKFIEADLLRALQTMPGITSLSDFSSALYVRGGTPDQNLFLVDGTDVYNPEHAFGIFSTFNTNAIKKVEISKGGFGAEYGGRLSSVMDITNLDGNRNEFEGIFNLSLLSASTTLQSPIGSIGSISASFRRTYLDQTVAKWVDDVPDYYFYDGNIKAYFDFDDKNKLSLSFFNSRDDLEFRVEKDQPNSFGFDYVWGNTTGSLNWKHIFSPKLFSSFWFTASRFEADFDMPRIYNLHEENYLSDYAAKIQFDYFPANNLKIKLGFEHKLLHFIYGQTWEEGIVDVNSHHQFTTGFTSIIYNPSVLWEIETGVRYNYYNSDKTFSNISPRASIKYKLSETSSIKLAGGKYHQYLNRIPRLFFASIWTGADKFNEKSSSSHLILGYQKELEEIFELEIEAYYKDYKNLHTFNMNFNSIVKPSGFTEDGKALYTGTEYLFDKGDGNSYGLEFLLRKNIGAVTGWVSYSYSSTHWTFNSINQGDEFKPRHNRSSIVNLVFNTDIESLISGNWNKPAPKSDTKWLLGISFVYASGQPLTLPGSAYSSYSIPDWNDINLSGKSIPNYKLYPATINAYQLPDYMRMDISLTYEIDYGTWKLSPYLQIFNVGNRKNIWFIDYKDEFVDGKITQTVEETDMLPILPSLGVTINF